MLAMMYAGCMLYTGEELQNFNKKLAIVTKVAGSIWKKKFQLNSIRKRRCRKKENFHMTQISPGAFIF